MKNKIRIFIFFATIQLQAQDMHFTQFYSSPAYLNPAFTGINVCSRFSVAYRNQWPGVTTAYKSYLASFDHFFTEKNLGAGILFGVDESGTGALRTTIINPLIAYELRLNREALIRFGLQPGFVIKSINFNKLYFGDQIYRGGPNVPTVESPTQNKKFMDIGTGILFSYKNFWLGSSFYHLNKPLESFYDDNDVRLPIKSSVHGGYRFVLNPDVVQESSEKSIISSFHYRAQGKFDQLDIGFYYSEHVFNIGLWYRGIPVLKYYKPGYPNNDAVSIIVGVALDKFKIGYSYDITISNLSYYSRGAHELTLSHQFCKLKKGRKVKNTKVVYCPKF